MSRIMYKYKSITHIILRWMKNNNCNSLGFNASSSLNFSSKNFIKFWWFEGGIPAWQTNTLCIPRPKHQKNSTWRLLSKNSFIHVCFNSDVYCYHLPSTKLERKTKISTKEVKTYEFAGETNVRWWQDVNPWRGVIVPFDHEEWSPQTTTTTQNHKITKISTCSSEKRKIFSLNKLFQQQQQKKKSIEGSAQ